MQKINNAETVVTLERERERERESYSLENKRYNTMNNMNKAKPIDR